jgi:CheY-like chemotaxis protein
MNGPRPRTTGFAILVIVDEQSVRDAAADLLQTDGHMVLVASTGEDGLAMVRGVLPDLILVDHHMPVMNGLEVVQRLKVDAETRRIPLVALTSGPDEDASELSRAGCIAFIPKPFEPASFPRLVAGILNVTVERRRSHAPLDHPIRPPEH